MFSLNSHSIGDWISEKDLLLLDEWIYFNRNVQRNKENHHLRYQKINVSINQDEGTTALRKFQNKGDLNCRCVRLLVNIVTPVTFLSKERFDSQEHFRTTNDKLASSPFRNSITHIKYHILRKNVMFKCTKISWLLRLFWQNAKFENKNKRGFNEHGRMYVKKTRIHDALT